jgi:glycosyltransferase involved in cell wall biosynthesis
MRICLASQEYPPGYVGGIGTQCRVKAKALAARGHEVHVLTAGDGATPGLSSRDEEGVTVCELHAPTGGFDVYKTESYWIGYSWAVLGALRALSAMRPFDVVDFPDYGAEGFAYQLDRTAEDPAAVVVHLHGSLRMFAERIGWPEPHTDLYRVGTFMEDFSLSNADRLLAASASIAQLTASHATAAADIDVVAGAVDSELFSPAAARASSDGETRVLFAGNVVANKGVGTVLEAFIRIAPSHPRVSLLIAGSSEDATCDQVRARALSAGVAERVQLLGFVEHSELPALYRSVDVLAVPSQYEGGPGMVYLEAMACGLPVIAGRAGGAAEAVADGETGILVAPDDSERTAAALTALLGDAQLRARMGAAGRRRVQEHFGERRYAELLERSYERAAAHRREALATS